MAFPSVVHMLNELTFNWKMFFSSTSRTPIIKPSHIATFYVTPLHHFKKKQLRCTWFTYSRRIHLSLEVKLLKGKQLTTNERWHQRDQALKSKKRPTNREFESLHFYFLFFIYFTERERELAYTHDIAHPRLSVEMIHSDYGRLRCMPNPVPQIQMINHQQRHSQRHQHYIQVPCLPPHLHHRIHSAPLNPISKPSKITHTSSNLRTFKDYSQFIKPPKTSATLLLLLELSETLKVSR